MPTPAFPSAVDHPASQPAITETLGLGSTVATPAVAVPRPASSATNHAANQFRNAPGNSIQAALTEQCLRQQADAAQTQATSSPLTGDLPAEPAAPPTASTPEHETAATDQPNEQAHQPAASPLPPLQGSPYSPYGMPPDNYPRFDGSLTSTAQRELSNGYQHDQSHYFDATSQSIKNFEDMIRQNDEICKNQ